MLLERLVYALRYNLRNQGFCLFITVLLHILRVFNLRSSFLILVSDRNIELALCPLRTSFDCFVHRIPRFLLHDLLSHQQCPNFTFLKIKDLFYFLLCICLSECMLHIYGCLWKPDENSDSLELELQGVPYCLSWVVRTELCFSAREVHILSC